VTTYISYNKHRHSNKERTEPGLSHSRYVHLKLLGNHVRRVIDLFIKGKGDKGVLVDLGCGEMPYKPWIEPYVKKYLGVDIPGNPRADSIVNLETNKCDLPDGIADFVWSVGVLEHVADTGKYLQECHRLLKKGGKLLLCTHGTWMYHPDPIDYWRFTSEGLKVTIQRTGFKIEESKGIMGLLPTSLQLYQDAVLLSLPYARLWKTPFCFVMQRLIALSSYFTRKSKTLRAYQDKDACLYFVVAEKIKPDELPIL